MNLKELEALEQVVTLADPDSIVAANVVAFELRRLEREGGISLDEIAEYGRLCEVQRKATATRQHQTLGDGTAASKLRRLHQLWEQQRKAGPKP